MPYLTVADYVASAGDQLLPQTAKTVIMASGYLVAGAAAAGDTTIDIDGASTAGVPDEAAFFFGTANGNVYRADGAVAVGATDATVLTVTLDRGLAASVADNAAVVNVPTDRITDTARIQIHITDAHGICRTYLPAALMDAAGDEVALADLSITLREVLPGIITNICRYSLATGETAKEDNKARYDAAIALLVELRGPVDPDTGGAGVTAEPLRAQVFSGNEEWLPGLPDQNLPPRYR